MTPADLGIRIVACPAMPSDVIVLVRADWTVDAVIKIYLDRPVYVGQAPSSSPTKGNP